MPFGITTKLQRETTGVGPRFSTPSKMSQFTRSLLFVLFFLSGFSGLVYQVVWVRMAFAAFGIIIQVLAVVVGVFMIGLSLGEWSAGRSRKFLARTPRCARFW